MIDASTFVMLVGGALASGGAGLTMAFHARASEARQNIHEMEARIEHAKTEMDKAGAHLDWLENRCADTHTNEVGAHRCVDEVGHVGMHYDGTLGWFGDAEFPPPARSVAA